MARRLLSNINTIILHCSATPEGREVLVTDIDRWHRKRGWDMIGYHYFIDLEGVIWKGRELEQIGAHAKGNNFSSVGICYAGGMDADNKKPKDTLTSDQQDSMSNLIMGLGTVLQQPLKVIGHNDISNKACPSFDVRQKFAWELKQLIPLDSSAY
jgi:N-acetylmuramoyl-L-alanine amidase